MCCCTQAKSYDTFRPVTPQQASEHRWQDSLFESGPGRRVVLHAPGELLLTSEL